MYKTVKKNGKLPANLAGKTLWNKICVYLIGPYKIRIKGKYPLILKYTTIKTKPVSHRNLQANTIIERIHQLLGKLVRTYILQETYADDDDPWMGILAAVDFAVRSTCHRTK